MASIDQIDHFFATQKVGDFVKWYPVTAETSGLYGLMQHPDGRFCRMPKEVAEAVNAEAETENVYQLYTNTSGGRLRLVTDSKVIAVKVTLGQAFGSSRGTFLGTGGMDLFQRDNGEWKYIGCLTADEFEDSVDAEGNPSKAFESMLRFGSAKKRELMLHFPLYADVRSVELGLDHEAVWEEAPGYEKKVVFYGSSITQGGCAPMPGVSYPAILSRRLNFDFVNLGFSAGAQAEPSMLDYLCSLPMDALVFDYDHNAPTLEFLQRTHMKAYQTIREKRPELPIIMASAPYAHLDEVWEKRREVVLATYQYALEHGDTRIAFVDGAKMFPEDCRAECSVDGVHPNGLGMSCMAKAFEPVLRQMLQVK